MSTTPKSRWRYVGHLGQAIAVGGLAMAYFSTSGYGGAMSCRGWAKLICFLQSLLWLFGSQLVAAPLQWVGVMHTQGKLKVLAIFGAVASTLVVLAFGWFYMSFFWPK